MTRAQRILIGFALPVFTLLLGWQLGIRHAQKALADERERLDMLFGVTSGSGTVVTDPEKEADLTLVWSVWRLLLSRYIDTDQLKTDVLVEGAAKGLVDAVGDPYTLLMDKSENEDFRDQLSGHLQGIGAELALRKDAVVIVAPLKSSPAERAGLLPQDVIVEVDGKPVEGKSLADVVSSIRGEKDTSVTLTIERPGESELLKKTIVREDILVPSTEFALRETDAGPVGVLSVNQFGDDTIAESDAILRDNVIGKDLAGLIIDLRYNGGGYLEGAVDMVSRFLKSGTVVTVERRDSVRDHGVTGNPVLPDIPLVVLINEGSASASEIVAGALQDHKRATIVGKKSFGKGTVQEVLDLPGGDSLRVTIAKWLTPDGRDLGKEGVVPDIDVDRTPEDIEAEKDPQLDAAVNWLSEKKSVSAR
jgi:carboxyl-terminal processing protease